MGALTLDFTPQGEKVSESPSLGVLGGTALGAESSPKHTAPSSAPLATCLWSRFQRPHHVASSTPEMSPSSRRCGARQLNDRSLAKPVPTLA